MTPSEQAVEPCAPETQPAAQRYRPPSLPSAPPGTADSGGDFDDPHRASASLATIFDDCRPLLDSADADAASTLDIRATLHNTRDSLSDILLSFRHSVESAGTCYQGTDLRQLKRQLLRLSVLGESRSRLDAAVGTDVFTRVAATEALGASARPDPRYLYPRPPHVNVYRLGLQPAGTFMRHILQALAEACANGGHCLNRHVFEREVVQPFLVLTHAVRCATPSAPILPRWARPQWILPSHDDPEEQRIREWAGG